MKGKVALHNLGCKVNAYETEAMQQMLEAAGYEIVPFEPGADIYVINTCSVTNIADRKSRQMLHKAKKMNPDAIVVAAGCYVQADTKKAEADASIDIIIGNNKKQELIPILESYRTGHQKTTECVDINHTKEYENLEIDRTEEHTRAYLKVQDGCNQFCTYCIIPYARGRIRSKKTEDVVNEVKRLAASGCQEVVLTGIHLSSYGKERPEDQENLLTLIQASGGRNREDPSWFAGTGNYHRRICSGDQQSAESVPAFSSVFAERMYHHIKADEPSLYRRRVPGKMLNPEKILSGTGTDDRCDHRISGRNGRRI